MFADRLKKAMQLRSKRQIDVCLACGISRTMMSLYLSGKRTPKLPTINKIAVFLNVEPSFLLGLTDQMFIPTIKPIISLYPNEEDDIRKALLDEITSICSFEDTDNLKTILNVIKTLAKEYKK